jgi:acetyl esterase/lipase
MRIILLIISALAVELSIFAQEFQYKTYTNIHYYSDSVNQSDTYINERCVLDIYFPQNSAKFATIVWFHGGGLVEGNKEIPEALMGKGLCVVGVNYRLYPKVKAPLYINDAAAAVSWVFKNINSYGGDSTLIFVSGHSAGGYLTTMIGLDKSYLHRHNIDANNIAGLISLSGQTITHFTIRKERGIQGTQPVVDSLAPLFHVRPEAPPLILITGDRELELLGRYEENAYLMRMMKLAGHKETKLYELGGYDHSMTFPAFPLLLKEVERIKKSKNDKQ